MRELSKEQVMKTIAELSCKLGTTELTDLAIGIQSYPDDVIDLLNRRVCVQLEELRGLLNTIKENYDE